MTMTRVFVDFGHNGKASFKPWLVVFVMCTLTQSVIGHCVCRNKPLSQCSFTNCMGQSETTLYLSDRHLSGKVPASLGSFKELTSLDLASNQLSGKVPASLGSLNKLTHLDLSNNPRLGGVVPAFWCVSPHFDFTNTLIAKTCFGTAFVIYSVGIVVAILAATFVVVLILRCREHYANSERAVTTTNSNSERAPALDARVSTTRVELSTSTTTVPVAMAVAETYRTPAEAAAALSQIP